MFVSPLSCDLPQRSFSSPHLEQKRPGVARTDSINCCGRGKRSQIIGRKLIRQARRVVCLRHAGFQHNHQHGKAYPQCPAVICPVRTGGHWGAGEGQDRRFQEERSLHGGNIPLGYTNRDKKLVIVPEEADRVRWIFRRYLELGSIGLLLEEMNRLGIRTKVQTLSSGKRRRGVPYGKGALAYLLRNRCNVGEIVHQGGCPCWGPRGHHRQDRIQCRSGVAGRQYRP